MNVSFSQRQFSLMLWWHPWIHYALFGWLLSSQVILPEFSPWHGFQGTLAFKSWRLEVEMTHSTGLALKSWIRRDYPGFSWSWVTSSDWLNLLFTPDTQQLSPLLSPVLSFEMITCSAISHSLGTIHFPIHCSLISPFPLHWNCFGKG